jgi:hypothetical protein
MTRVRVGQPNNAKVKILNPAIDIELAAKACARASVANSDNTYSATVASGGSLSLPDIEVTDVDGSTRVVPSVQDVVCQDLPFTYNWPRINQTVSYVTGDAGQVNNDFYAAFLDSLPARVRTPQLDTFTSLKEPNLFGNLNRFTDINGAQVYPIISGSIRYAIDHYTGIGWAYSSSSSYGVDTFNAACPAIYSLSFGGYDDWFVSPIEFLNSLVNNNLSVVYQYPPFNISSSLFFMSSSTLEHSTTLAAGLITNYDIGSTNKTTSRAYYICRKHF